MAGRNGGGSPEPIELIEPVAIAAVYCTGVARAFVDNGEVHLLWYVDQPGVDGVERVANLRTVMRVEAFPAARALVDEALREAREKKGRGN